VYSGMDAQKQVLAQDKSLYKENGKFTRKIVMATNVAESSLTIDGIKSVINTGYELKSSFDPENRARKLDRQFASKSQQIQRCGRAGRTEPGQCYHMYTKDDFENKMIQYPEPEIKTSDITLECLNLISIDTILTVPKLINTLANFIEPPREINIRVAITNLMRLGLIENDTITPLGKIINELPINDIIMSLSLFFGKLYKCSDEILKISCMIEASKANLNDIYRSPLDLLQNKRSEMDEDKFMKLLASLNNKFNNARKKLMQNYGDHLTLLKIFDKFDLIYNKNRNNMEKLNEWCYDNFLKLNTLMKARQNYKKLKWQVNSLFKNPLKSEDYNLKNFEEINKLNVNERVISCLVLGYRLNTAILINGSENYRTQYSKNLKINVSKLSTILLLKKLPKNIFYYELFISMGKNDLNIVSKIPKEIIKIIE
jgi:HrpA-like RNA helicase